MKKDAKIGLAIILGAVLLSALLVGKALQRREKRNIEIPDSVSQVDETAGQSASADAGGETSGAMDRLLTGGTPPTEVPDAVRDGAQVPAGSDLPVPVPDATAGGSGDLALVDAGTGGPAVSSPGAAGSPAFGLAGNVGGDGSRHSGGVSGPAAGSAGTDQAPLSGTSEAAGTEALPAAVAADVGEIPAEGSTGPSGAAPTGSAQQSGSAVSETAPASGSDFTYTVQDGDSAWKLAKRFYGSGTSFVRIKKANPGINVDNLVVGTKLVIPGKASSTTAPVPGSDSTAVVPAGAGTADAGGVRIHSVAAGESLYVIADKLLGSGSRYREIEALNPGLNPRALKIGQRLRIPAR